ncbi:MAG: GntR family transcriptional regulator [Planctomycetota bacterium]
MRVSEITVKRAHLELEREEVILTRLFRGSCVSDRPGLSSGLGDRELGEHLNKEGELARLRRVDAAKLEARLRAATEQQ